jgi:hypothetical protein
MSPDTPYLASAEFRFTYRYNDMLISPPWPLLMENILEYFKEGRVMRVAEHLGRVYAPLTVIRRIAPAHEYMSPELLTWLQQYESMNRYVFKSELKVHLAKGIHRLVREDYGTNGLPYQPEEDEAIKRYYRAHMSAADKNKLMTTCFGRSLRSISLRAGILRNEMMSQGIYDMSKLPHGQRSESILSTIREFKKKEAKRRAREEREAREAIEDAERAAQIAQRPKRRTKVV